VNLYYFFGWLLTGLYSYLWHRTRYYRKAKLPRKTGYLIVCNHQSFADPNLVAFGLYRGVAFMARSSLFKGFLGWWLPRVWCLPVERGSSDRASIRRTVDMLKSGRPLILFPEGTRSRDGKLQGFKRGLELIARQAGVPILPAAIHGVGAAFPKGASFPKPSKVRITYGELVSLEELKEIGTEGVRERVQALMTEMDERFGSADPVSPSPDPASSGQKD
jgi:1-acyl-sn-glycerol-3-phosphate acyltransferase